MIPASALYVLLRCDAFVLCPMLQYSEGVQEACEGAKERGRFIRISRNAVRSPGSDSKSSFALRNDLQLGVSSQASRA